MKLELDGIAIEYLRRQNQSDVTLDLEEINSNCCVRTLPDLKIHKDPPKNPGKYRHFSAQGINFYKSKQLRTEHTLIFSLSGVDPFKKLEVSSVNLIL